MNYPYLNILMQWPLILAAIITFFIVKSYFSRANNPKVAIYLISEQLISNAIRDSLSEVKRNNLTNGWLEKAKKVNSLINQLQRDSTFQIHDKKEEIEYNLDTWQKLSLDWVLIWSGTTSFFIIEMILDPIIWGRNWVLLPYFFYYIAIMLIYYFKR